MSAGSSSNPRLVLLRIYSLGTYISLPHTRHCSCDLTGRDCGCVLLYFLFASHTIRSLTVPEVPESNHPDVWKEPLRGLLRATLLQGADPTCPEGPLIGQLTLDESQLRLPAWPVHCLWDSVETSQGLCAKAGRRPFLRVSQDRAGGRTHRPRSASTPSEVACDGPRE